MPKPKKKTKSKALKLPHKKVKLRSSIDLEHDEFPSRTPDEEQGIKAETHGDEEALEMDLNEKDEDIYDETGREKQVDDDDISDAEEAFVEGYSSKGRLGHCAHCGKQLDEQSTLELEHNNKTLWFCSTKCVNLYRKKRG